MKHISLILNALLLAAVICSSGCDGGGKPPLAAVPQSPPAMATVFHVATAGVDTNTGTIEQPFATLERAREAIRELKKPSGGLPAGGATVYLRGGVYSHGMVPPNAFPNPGNRFAGASTTAKGVFK